MFLKGILLLFTLFISNNYATSTNAFSSKDNRPPNIIFFLTDDQDQMLGGSFPTIGEATPVRFFF